MIMPNPQVLRKLMENAPTVSKYISLLMRTHRPNTFAGVDDLSPFHVALLTILSDNLLVCLKDDVLIAVYRGEEQLLGFTVFLGVQQGLCTSILGNMHFTTDIGLAAVSSLYPLPASIKHLPFDWDLFKCVHVDLIMAEYERTNRGNN